MFTFRVPKDGEKFVCGAHGRILAPLLFLGAAFGILILGTGQVAHKIKAPFQKKKPAAETAAAVDLRTKDTDRDGLSDFDEQSIYLTSPYLEDSDSDGASDRNEIDRGTDPNCPEGKNCFTVSAEVPQQFEPGLTPPPLTTAAIPSFDPALLREMLRGSGVPQEALSKLTDAELKQLYDETLREIGSATSTPNTPTAADIRLILKAFGLSETELSGLGDEGVKKLYEQLVK